MDRDIALRVDGMLISARETIGAIVVHLNNNIEIEELRTYFQYTGNAMAALVDFSNVIHNMYPDIIPKELKSSDDS